MGPRRLIVLLIAVVAAGATAMYARSWIEGQRTTIAAVAAPAPDIAVNPLSLGYGPVTVGMTAPLTTTIENLGTADLVVTALNLTGSTDFALGAGAPALPLTVAPAAIVKLSLNVMVLTPALTAPLPPFLVVSPASMVPSLSSSM